MTDEQHLKAAMAHIAAMRLLTTQDCLDLADEQLRKFTWPHDTGAAADIQSCIYGLEETKRAEDKADEQYKAPEFDKRLRYQDRGEFDKQAMRELSRAI